MRPFARSTIGLKEDIIGVGTARLGGGPGHNSRPATRVAPRTIKLTGRDAKAPDTQIHALYDAQGEVR